MIPCACHPLLTGELEQSMDNKSAKRATIILGVIMIIAIGSSAILPLFTRNNTASTTPEATTLPTSTLPPVVTDLNSIQFDQDFLHSSGLFSVAQPTGWSIGQQTGDASGAEVTMNNGELISVIQSSVQISPTLITTMDELEAIYSAEALNASWSNYRRDTATGLNFRETARVREDDYLRLDFELKNQRQQTLVARQLAWYDQDWVYSVRVVMPENQVELLKYVTQNMKASFKANRIFAGSPADWKAYFDPTNSFVIRYPSAWTLTDSAPGRPASMDGAKSSLRVETQAVSAPLDDAAARAWVESSRPDVTVTSVQPATRGDASGFAVAYTYVDADGAHSSGLALLLNGGDNTVHIANLRMFSPDVDLNQDTAQVAYPDENNVLKSFQPLAGLNVPLPTPTPTFTPAPTHTATATSEASATPVPSNTPEPTATATHTEVPPTATATNTAVPPTSTPKPTNTPVPPSATPVPPSATPVPPSATPVPPTSTPVVEATAEVTASS